MQGTFWQIARLVRANATDRKAYRGGPVHRVCPDDASRTTSVGAVPPLWQDRQQALDQDGKSREQGKLTLRLLVKSGVKLDEIYDSIADSLNDVLER